MQRIGRVKFRIAHVQALEFRLASKFIGASILAGRTVDGECDRDCGSFRGRVVDAITQHRNRKPGRIGIQRDERTEGFQRDLNRQMRILERDARQRKFAGESGAFQPAQSGRIARS